MRRLQRRDLGTQASANRAEHGAAYIVVLLVLVVLTTLGASVAMISQTEFLIGGAERMVHRVFYAADSGVQAATMRGLVDGDFSAVTIEIPEVGSPAALDVRQSVELSPFLPTLEAPCNLCEINNIGTYSERSYRAINYVITTRATRLAGPGGKSMATGTVGAIVEVQPWKSVTESYLPIDDPAALAKIRF